MSTGVVSNDPTIINSYNCSRVNFFGNRQMVCGDIHSTSPNTSFLLCVATMKPALKKCLNSLHELRRNMCQSFGAMDNI